ncbi:rho GTPase-activating protein conundrum isoform X2 [Danaus plexippus]|uniref:rho GTPase-activating protein conundrum isoform X2 n=1 Tax=Danaus plexippus TaxID=13037 RepID=UPI0013C4F7C1|nr:rho GTPase-activating protein conundrum isoform X2 [Danaus plexippus plexippus]XP_061385615.1 rho GTPase-activating protein conundrum isoform X2 [Danaus plexippus]
MVVILKYGTAEYVNFFHCEGELETEWLQSAGLASLAAPFQAGLEVSEAQLGEAVRPLPREQAAAVRRRVRRLNRTVRRRRAASRAKKPDIRDVFRDLENSSGSEPRSRSATPDSLDSLPSGGSGSPPTEWADTATPPDFVDSYPVGTHAPLARTPSAPARRIRVSPPGPNAHSPPRPCHELFKPNDLHWADIASNTEGIELLGYQRYGTVQGPRIGKERINGTILKSNDPFIKHTAVSRTKSAASAQQPLSFEHKFNLDRQMLDHEEEWPEVDSTVDIETVSEPQLKKLQPLLWLELTALFDRYSLPFHKRKPPKKKRKEEGAVFGVSLETLLRKDMLLWEETWSSVPAVLRALASALRDRAAQSGLLRVPGNKHKIEALCQLIERQWYEDRSSVESALHRATGHDLAAVFKRLLRSLPQPPLTQELMRLFYQTYTLSGASQGRALNLLVLLLPAEQRATLREVLRLVREIAAMADTNKMNEHNVAMIIAPALFPPSLLIKQSDSLETQLATAANSVHVTEALMRWCDRLWCVPPSLLAASHRKPGPHRRNNHT